MRTNIIVTWHSVLKDIDDLIKSEAAIAESVEVISDVERSAGGAEPDQYTKLNLMSDRLTFKRKEGETRILGFAAADMMGTFADLNNRAFGKASPSEAEGCYAMRMCNRMSANKNFLDAARVKLASGDRIFLIKKADDTLPVSSYQTWYKSITAAVTDRVKQTVRHRTFCNADETLTDAQINTAITNIMSTMDTYMGSISAGAWTAFDKDVLLTGSTSASGQTYKARIYTHS